ncbi:protein-disulfide isomerase [Aeromicrobium panaciterrae]|uniref:Protein-disulfide isomerase n=1 Tax=Aeromicrobium panaciterrae TaxID=363861 RepID=A0ABU1UQS1_9ACTN|nr:DsbA family protein [Aeromicrobium panaciterrae]MDR7087522.1 protein-disulfide isomerase [Aeromicrobium panaciterrae]
MANERQERAARAEQMRKEREKADRKQRNLISIAIVTVVIALIAVGGYAVKSANDKNKTNTELIAPKNVNADYGFVYDAEAAGGEAGKNPVKVILTEDFQCPACLSFEQQSSVFLNDLVKKGEITIEYRPISFLDGSSANEYSSRALNAALCVLDKGGIEKYKIMHDLLYANQPDEGTAGPDDAALIETAKAAGVTGIDSCVISKRFGPWIEDAYEKLADDGFKGTPWVRIGGKDVKAPTPAGLQQAIDAAKKA